MDYGAIITGGVCPWQIFQRNSEGTAPISLWGTWRRIRQSFELPLEFSQVPEGAVTVRARIVRETSGEDVIGWTEAAVEEQGTWSLTFPAVPAGGLYRIETAMDYFGSDGLSSTRGDMVHHIGVGDLFVVAGQSNAAGRAKDTIEDGPELGVHLLRNSGRWDLASHPMGETTGAVHLGHFENQNPGHTPWLHFGKILRRELGIPIGFVMSAYGGAPLRWWNPEENGALYRNMLEQLAEYDLHPRAVLWYQGEADGFGDEPDVASYGDRFTAFVEHLRRDLRQPDLPVLTVQLNRYMVHQPQEQLDRSWGRIREDQRQLPRRLKGVYVVPAIDVPLFDHIHNSAAGNLMVGERCARCALAVLYGTPVRWQAVEPEKAVRLAPDQVELRLGRVENQVGTFGVAPELLPIEAEDAAGLVKPAAYELGQAFIRITFPRPLGEGAVLHGAWRADPGPCIPWDVGRMPMLAFYGLSISDSD